TWHFVLPEDILLAAGADRAAGAAHERVGLPPARAGRRAAGGAGAPGTAARGRRGPRGADAPLLPVPRAGDAERLPLVGEPEGSRGEAGCGADPFGAGEDRRGGPDVLVRAAVASRPRACAARTPAPAL